METILIILFAFGMLATVCLLLGMYLFIMLVRNLSEISSQIKNTGDCVLTLMPRYEQNMEIKLSRTL